MIFKKYRTKVAEQNFATNLLQAHPSGMINGQAAYSGYRFGLTTLDRTGCGIIAIYNTLHLLECPEKLPLLIRIFETNSTETVPFGFWGINPFSMKKFFSDCNLNFTKIRRIRNLDTCKTEGGVYMLTFWNHAKNWVNGAHTVAVQYRNGQFWVYNRFNSVSEATVYSKAVDILQDGLLICGYCLTGKGDCGGE